MPPAGAHAPSGIPRPRGRVMPTPHMPRQLETPLGKIQPVFDGFSLAETSAWGEPPTPAGDVFGGHRRLPTQVSTASSSAASRLSPLAVPHQPNLHPPQSQLETPRAIAPLRASKYKTPIPPPIQALPSVSGPAHPDDLYARRLADSVRQTPTTSSLPAPSPVMTGKRAAPMSMAHTPRKRAPVAGGPSTTRSGTTTAPRRRVVAGGGMSRKERAKAGGHAPWRALTEREVAAAATTGLGSSSRASAVTPVVLPPRVEPSASTPAHPSTFTFAYPPPSTGRGLRYASPRPELGREIVQQQRYASPAVSATTADGRDEDWDVSARTGTPRNASTTVVTASTTPREASKPTTPESTVLLSPTKRPDPDRSPGRIAYWAPPRSPSPSSHVALESEAEVALLERSGHGLDSGAHRTKNSFNEPRDEEHHVNDGDGNDHRAREHNADELNVDKHIANERNSPAHNPHKHYPNERTGQRNPDQPVGQTPSDAELSQPEAVVTPASRRSSGGLLGLLTSIFGASPAVEGSSIGPPASAKAAPAQKPMTQLSPSKPVTMPSKRLPVESARPGDGRSGRSAAPSKSSTRPKPPVPATQGRAAPSRHRAHRIPDVAPARQPLGVSHADNVPSGHRNLAMPTAASKARAKAPSTGATNKLPASGTVPATSSGQANGKRKVVAPSPERTRMRSHASAPAKRPKPPAALNAPQNSIRALPVRPPPHPRPAVRQSSFVAMKLAALPKPGQGASSAAQPVNIRDHERARDLEVKRAMFERGYGPDPDAPRPPPARSDNATLSSRPVMQPTKPGRVPGEATRRRAEIQAANRAERDRRDAEAAAKAAEEARVLAEIEAEQERKARQATVFRAQPLPPMYNGSRQ